jgi:membrane associated rhomboid family serine protease
MYESWDIEAPQSRRKRFFGFLRLRVSPAVGILMAITIAVFLVQIVLDAFTRSELVAFEDWLALTPAQAIARGRIWQFGSYAFLHSARTPFHIFFNMLILFFMGPHVESVTGARRFVVLYLTSGVGAGIAHSALAYSHPVLGASGAVLGITAAFAFFFPDARMLLFFIVPIKARHLVWVIAGIDLFVALGGGGPSDVAAFAHLGGLLTGYMFVRYEWDLRTFIAAQQDRWRERREREGEDIRERVDDLLDKVHREGLQSLTRREKAFLKRASEHFRR